MTHRPLKDDTLEFPAVPGSVVNPSASLEQFPSVTPAERRALWIITAIMLSCFVLAMTAPDANAGSRCFVPPTATVKHQPIEAGQQRNTTIALRLADRMHAPYSHKVAVVAAATQEDAQWNRPRGHGTSVGYLQLINLHGTVEWRMQVTNSAGWFLRGVRQRDPRGTARLRTTRDGWGLIQQQQASGHPYAYNQWIAEAIRTVNKYRATCA